MKKRLCFWGVLLFGIVLLAGCSTGKTPSKKEKSAGNRSIVCTTFPQYDWIRNLLGEAGEVFDVTLLVKNSADIHNYQPSTQDIVAIKEADLFVFVGGESEAWVQDMIAADSDVAEHSVSLIEVLGDEILTQGYLQEAGDVEHEHEYTHEHEHGEEFPDEHVWLSLEKAEVLCRHISKQLLLLAPEYEKEISDNTARYIEKLRALGGEYAAAVAESAGNPLIFGDRFPFSYLAEDYALECYAAYTGCSAEVEVGFDTIISLAEKVDAFSSEYVLVIDGSDNSIAKTVISTAKADNIEILELNSMQSVSYEDIQAGTSYLGIMQDNLEVLKIALGQETE